MSRGKSYTFSEGPKREKAVLNRGSFTFSRSRFFHHCYSTNDRRIERQTKELRVSTC
ncbi:unnamed protein product, partial [Vitis vinifera]